MNQAPYFNISGTQATAALRPAYVTGAMNSNPVVRFNSGNYLAMNSWYTFEYDNSVFTVFRTAALTGTLNVGNINLNPASSFCDRVVGLTAGRFVGSISGQAITSTNSVNTNTAQLGTFRYAT